MKTIYIAYIQSILEQSCTIWHRPGIDLNLEDRLALERVQNAFKNIFQDKYETYEKGLIDLNMDTLFARRHKLILKFGKKCFNLPQTKYIFHWMKINTVWRQKKNQEKYHVTKANTSRLYNSTIPYIQRLLNRKDSTSKFLLPSVLYHRAAIWLFELTLSLSLRVSKKCYCNHTHNNIISKERVFGNRNFKERHQKKKKTDYARNIEGKRQEN